MKINLVLPNKGEEEEKNELFPIIILFFFLTKPYFFQTLKLYNESDNLPNKMNIKFVEIWFAEKRQKGNALKINNPKRYFKNLQGATKCLSWPGILSYIYI